VTSAKPHTRIRFVPLRRAPPQFCITTQLGGESRLAVLIRRKDEGEDMQRLRSVGIVIESSRRFRDIVIANKPWQCTLKCTRVVVSTSCAW